MPPRSPTRSPSVQLPLEILALITAQCDRTTLKQIRLCNKYLAQEAVKHLFASLHFEMRVEDMERVVNIANSTDKIASAVKSIELRQTPALPDYSFNKWCGEFGHMCYPEGSFRRLVDGSPEHRDYIHARQKLFDEYQTQAKELTLYKCLNHRGPSLMERMHRPWPTQEDGLGVHDRGYCGFVKRFQQACLDFEEALLKLPNLHSFFANFPSAHEWRGCEWGDPMAFPEPSLPVAEQVAPLAFVLRALGRRSSISNSLTSVMLELLEPHWGLDEVELGLKPKRFESSRPECQALMEAAFTHVTDLRLDFDDDEYYRTGFETLARLFGVAKNLVRLTLYSFGYRPENFSSPDLDILKRIMVVAEWPKLEHLKLWNLGFKSSSLLRTLSHLAPTLESLVLEMCFLMDKKITWPVVYERMRYLPFERLHHLDFQQCTQYPPHPEGLERYPRAWCNEEVKNRSLVLHYSGSTEYFYKSTAGFSSKIYDYILKKTDTMPPLEQYTDDPPGWDTRYHHVLASESEAESSSSD